MRLLIVEDEPRLLGRLVKAAREEAYAVDPACAGDEGLYKAETYDYDAIVLGLMLPRLDGLEVLTRLRERKRTPVIMISVRSGIQDRIQSLDVGADDYIVKPFDARELFARLRAVIRRASGLGKSTIEIGDISVDTRGREVRRGGKPVALTAREYAILEYLALNSGAVQTRTTLYEHVFDERDHTKSNLIDVHVFSLRKKLGKDFILSRRGEGFFIRD
jgi:two-component system, OmpR family, response regulator